MIVTETIEQTRTTRRNLGRLAFVPTMGALHEGHLSLVRRAREKADHVAVSIFVNPTQFGPQEDLDQYPRPIERDLELCRAEGVDLVFNPDAETMYPPDDPAMTLEFPGLTDQLEGAERPGHFSGVCGVVTKLFNIVQPDLACFGRKDYQQLRVIEAMTRAMCLPIEIDAGPTVRESDGLAMSSRNVYLDADQRRRALGLSKALREATTLIREGAIEPEPIERAMQQVLEAHKLEIDYAVVRDARTLQPVDVIDPPREPIVCLLAARAGQVRLIDNALLEGTDATP